MTGFPEHNTSHSRLPLHKHTYTVFLILNITIKSVRSLGRLQRHNLYTKGPEIQSIGLKVEKVCGGRLQYISFKSQHFFIR